MFLTITRLMDFSAFFIMLAFIPQAHILWKSNEPQNIYGLSLSTFFMYSIGQISWILYGFFIYNYIFSLLKIFFLFIMLYCTYKIIVVRYNLLSYKQQTEI